MPASVPVRLKPLKVTVLALATLALLYVPTAVPVMLTVSPVYGLPSLELPLPAVSELSNAAVPDTVAVVLPS